MGGIDVFWTYKWEETYFVGFLLCISLLYPALVGPAERWQTWKHKLAVCSVGSQVSVWIEGRKGMNINCPVESPPRPGPRGKGREGWEGAGRPPPPWAPRPPGRLSVPCLSPRGQVWDPGESLGSRHLRFQVVSEAQGGEVLCGSPPSRAGAWPECQTSAIPVQHRATAAPSPRVLCP